MNGLNFHDEMVSQMNKTYLPLSAEQVVEIRAEERENTIADVRAELNKYKRDINLANCPFGFIDLALDNVRRKIGEQK